MPRRLHAEQWYVITSDVTGTPGQSPSQITSQSWSTNKLCPFQYKLATVYATCVRSEVECACSVWPNIVQQKSSQRHCNELRLSNM